MLFDGFLRDMFYDHLIDLISKMGLVYLRLDHMGIRPNGFRQHGNKPVSLPSWFPHQPSYHTPFRLFGFRPNGYYTKWI